VASLQDKIPGINKKERYAPFLFIVALEPISVVNERCVEPQKGWMQGAGRSEWSFHSQTLQRSRRPFVVQPSGPVMHYAHGVVARCSFGVTKLRNSRLALRAMHGRRTFVYY